MSLRENLSAAADVADIIALQQRAELIATQNAQLSTLRQLRDHARIQAFELEKEKTLQNTLFDLRRALATLASSIDQTPQKVAADLFLAEQTLRLVPPEAFTLLEWKELSVNVQQELAATIEA